MGLLLHQWFNVGYICYINGSKLVTIVTSMVQRWLLLLNQWFNVGDYRWLLLFTQWLH